MALSRTWYEEIRLFTDTFYREKVDLFQQRITQGWIRECHGDLHLGNIFFEQSPVIFDCIEFNERFRCSDVAVDLAFLVMDLDFQGVPELARRVVDRYVERSGDTGFLRLVDFYCCYRAYVRGKVISFQLDDERIGPEAKQTAALAAEKYFKLACSYIERS